MRLSYKRVKSRPNGVDLDRLNSIRSLFAIKFSRLIDRDTLLVNIDESCINRKVKSNYSWLFKGCPVEVNNSVISDSANLIMGICSNGSWITMILNETTDAARFIWFLKVMSSWLKSNSCFGYSKLAIILDNWAIHKSMATRRILQEIGCSVFFIPPYSPDFAPIEYCLV